ncbi:MAG: hypothetical protein IJ764_03405 [Bacteroidales bacterium]|nr:hypothetical protein [Bacteroidales bacterium]
MKYFCTPQERIAEILKYYKMNRADFAEKINVKPSVIYNLTAKNTRAKNFTADLLTAILHHCPELSPSWVLTGEGDMLKSNITQSATIGGDNMGSVNAITHTIGDSDRLLSIIEKQQKTIDNAATERGRLLSIIEHLTSIEAPL